MSSPFAEGGPRPRLSRGSTARAAASVRAVVAASCLLPLTASGAEPARRPNVVVMLADDLGYGDLGCYGHPAIRTPHLDRMAAEGLRLTACYAAAPVCSPSRTGLLTGRTPSRVGVYDWIPQGHPMHLPASEVTVAELLKTAGYDTCQVGKWHLNGAFASPKQPQPGDHGFDHWFATQNNAGPSHRNPANFVRDGVRVGPLEGYSCQLVADEAIGWLKGRQGENPFFLYVCFHEPHEPVESPDEIATTYVDGEGAKARNRDEAEYFAAVSNVDTAVGRLLAALAELGVDGETLVVFTSDNGPETLDRYPKANRSYGSPGPLRGMKLWLYEAGLRVPGIVRWPGGVEPGQTSDVPVCSLDLLPTLCELASVTPPSDRPLDGTSLVPLLKGGDLHRATPLYWDYFHALGSPKAALRDGDFVILGGRRGGNRPSGGNVTAESMAVLKEETLTDYELYDLSGDLSQRRDLAAERPDLVGALAAKLSAMHREVRDEGPTWAFPAGRRDK